MADPRIPKNSPSGERYAPCAVKQTLLCHPLVLAKHWPQAAAQGHILISDDDQLQIVPSWLVSPHGQRVELDRGFRWCSEKFKNELNAWLLEMFGEGECYHVLTHTKGAKREYSAGTRTLKQAIARQSPFVRPP